MFRKRSDAKTRRHRELQTTSARKQMRANLLANAFRHLAREVRISVGENDDKLVAAITRNCVRIADRRKNNGSHFHQHVRSDEMPMFIVHTFEVVEIEEQRRDA